MNNAFNFKQVFEHPIVLYRFGKVVLPFGVNLIRIILFFAIFILMLIFHRVVNFLFVWVHGMEAAVYLGIPFLLSNALLKVEKDGKKIHRFLSDFVHYVFTIYIPQRKYCNDQEVFYLNEKVQFEPLYMKQGGPDDEVKNANEADIQKLNAYKRRRNMGVLPDHAGSHSSVQ